MEKERILKYLVNKYIKNKYEKFDDIYEISVEFVNFVNLEIPNKLIHLEQIQLNENIITFTFNTYVISITKLEFYNRIRILKLRRINEVR